MCAVPQERVVVCCRQWLPVMGADIAGKGRGCCEKHRECEKCAFHGVSKMNVPNDGLILSS